MKSKKTSYSRRISRICTFFMLIVSLLYISAHVSLVYPKVSPDDFFLQQRRNPRIRAFLDMIAYAEGTLGTTGYRMHYAGGHFYDFSDHPRQVICAEYGLSRKQLCSSAAGRYQFLQKTWDYLAPKIKADNFGPLHQDRAAIAIIQERNALDLIKQGDLEAAIERLNMIWASFPGAPYGQRTYSLSHLKQIYEEQLARARGQT